MTASNAPMSDMEKEGLEMHGLPVDSPLSEAFRLGMSFALGNVRGSKLGFRVVNSGGMWEVYEKISGERFLKINPVASVIDHLSIHQKGGGFTLEVVTKPYPHLGYRPKTPVAQR